MTPSFWDGTKPFLVGHSDRKVQNELFEGVMKRLQDGEHLVGMEGGPGCGKSLIVGPLLRVNNLRPDPPRVIVSAFTRAQQDVLYRETAPRVKALCPRGAVMLKGRNNYLCQRRAREAGYKVELRGDGSRPYYPELADVWHLVCSDDEYDCHPEVCVGDAYFTAREASAATSLLITNHKLLALNHKLGGRILGETENDLLVVDEGHLMEQVLQETFGGSLSLRKLENADQRAAAFGIDLRNVVLAAQTGFDVITARIAAAEEDEKRGRKRGVVLRARAWSNWDLGEEIAHGLGLAALTLSEQLADELDAAVRDKERVRELRRALSRIEGLQETAGLLAAPTETHAVYSSVSSRQLSVDVRRFDVYDEFQEMAREEYRRTVVMSATLNQLAQDRLRLGPLVSAGEPFDTVRNRLAFCVEDDPGVTAANLWDETVLLDLMSASRGGALVVANAHAQKVRAADVLRGAGWRIGEQTSGSESVKGLISDLQGGRIDAIVGVDSVGTGIDIPGDALRLVVLVSAFNPNPFSDPFLDQWGDRFGGRAWPALFNKMADEKMDQSIGRLLRGPSDRGVVAFLDPRKKHQSRFLRWVTPSPVTSNIADVKEFFA